MFNKLKEMDKTLQEALLQFSLWLGACILWIVLYGIFSIILSGDILTAWAVVSGLCILIGTAIASVKIAEDF